MRPQEQIASHTHTVRRSSANNGLPYRQQHQLYEQEADEYEDAWPPPVPRSAIRYTTEPPSLPVPQAPAVPAPTITVGGRRYILHGTTPPQQQAPRRRAAPPPDDEEEDEAPPRHRHRRHHLVHWSFVSGVGMVA